MAVGTGLPVYGGGDEPVRGPGVSSGGDFGASAWATIARSADSLTETFQHTAELAKKQRLTLEAGDLAEQDLKTTNDYTDAQVRFQNDPAAFKAWSEEYRKNRAGAMGTGPQAEHFKKKSAQLEAGGYHSAAISKVHTDTQVAIKNTEALITQTSDKIEALAARGLGPGDAEYDQAIQEYNAQTTAYQTFPGIVPAVVTQNKRALELKSEGQREGYRVSNEIYQKQGLDDQGQPLGGFHKANKALQEKDFGPDSKYTPAEAAIGYKAAYARLERDHNIDKEDDAQLLATHNSYKLALEHRAPVDPVQLNKAIETLGRRGFAGQAGELDVRRMINGFLVPTNPTSAAQIQQGVVNTTKVGKFADLDKAVEEATQGRIKSSWVTAAALIESDNNPNAQDYYK